MEYQLAVSGENLDGFDDHEFSGIGLLRGEYICRKQESYIGTDAWRKEFNRYLVAMCERFSDRPVWYRSAELECSEVNVLFGADVIIERDPNPALGLRGARRACKYPDAFRTEISELTALARIYPNLHLIIPFLSNPEELRFLKREIELIGFPNKLGIMAEVPSAVLSLEDFLVQGVDHVLVGFNDLSSLTMGADRGSGFVDSTNPAIIKMLQMIRDATRKFDVSLAIAGYFDQAVIDVCRTMGFDAAVLHYSFLNRYEDFRALSLPEAGKLLEIKELTRAAIRARERRHWEHLLQV